MDNQMWICTLNVVKNLAVNNFAHFIFASACEIADVPKIRDSSLPKNHNIALVGTLFPATDTALMSD